MRTPEYDRDEMRRLHDRGLNVSQIALRLGCNKRTVQRFRRAEGLSQPINEFQGRPVTPERLDMARQMLDDGASVNETSRTLHIHRETIVRYLPGYSWSREQASEVARLTKRLLRIVPTEALNTRPPCPHGNSGVPRRGFGACTQCEAVIDQRRRAEWFRDSEPREVA